MKNFLFIIAFLIVLTAVIVGTNPQMHKPMNIGGARFEVQDNSQVKNTDLKVENKDSIIDKTPVAVKTVEQVKTVENITPKNVDVSDKWEQLLKLQEQEEQAKKLAQQKAQELAKKKAEAEALAKKKAEQQAKTLAEEQTKKLAQQKAQELAKKKAEAEALAKKKTDEQAKKLAQQKAQEEAKKKAEAQKKAEEQRKLVEYQENILWNQWRANVCNNVANKLDKQFAYVAPAGTVYTYSFDVDNQRRISNVVVKISRGYVNPTTQQGIFMIQNAIKSLNLSTTLTFPNGSQRTTVKVLSGIERTSSQSTSINANSFNDVEKVTKKKYE